MPTTYWIKLYHEILDDPKMAMLPDRLWRRIIELFLMAGRYNKGGILPDTNQIAWMLRMNTDELAMDMQQIQTTGIIERQVNGWLIPQFANRQIALTDAEKQKAYRERKHRDEYYIEESVTNSVTECVTNALPKVTQITDTDNRLTDTESDKETESSLRSDIFNLYSKYIGEIKPIIEPTLIRADEEYDPAWFPKAFEIMHGNGKKSWSYVEGILKNWQSNGYKPGNNGKPKVTDRTSENARRKYAERVK